jgi:hypothetical protein
MRSLIRRDKGVGHAGRRTGSGRRDLLTSERMARCKTVPPSAPADALLAVPPIRGEGAFITAWLLDRHWRSSILHQCNVQLL